MSYRTITLSNKYAALVKTGSSIIPKKLREGQEFRKGDILIVQPSVKRPYPELPTFVLAQVESVTTTNGHYHLKNGCVQVALKVVHDGTTAPQENESTVA